MDPTDTPEWRRTAVEATAAFNREHAGVPTEDWSAADIETEQNLALVRRCTTAA